MIARCASNESQPLSHETLESLAKVAQQVELWAMEEESDDSNTLLWLSRSIYARWLARKGETGAAIRHSFVREGVFALLTMASDAFSNKSPKSNQDAESEQYVSATLSPKITEESSNVCWQFILNNTKRKGERALIRFRGTDSCL